MVFNAGLALTMPRATRAKKGPFLESPENFSGTKAICETDNRLFWKADLLTCFRGN